MNIYCSVSLKKLDVRSGRDVQKSKNCVFNEQASFSKCSVHIMYFKGHSVTKLMQIFSFCSYFSEFESEKRFNIYSAALVCTAHTHMLTPHVNHNCSCCCMFSVSLSLDKWSVSEQRGSGNPRHDKANQRILP